MMSYPNPNWFENFKKVQKEGEKMCCWCYVVFKHDGFPVKDSWCCSQYCNNQKPKDTISRVYLIDNTNYSINMEPTQFYEASSKTKCAECDNGVHIVIKDITEEWDGNVDYCVLCYFCCDEGFESLKKRMEQK